MSSPLIHKDLCVLHHDDKVDDVTGPASETTGLTEWVPPDRHVKKETHLVEEHVSFTSYVPKLVQLVNTKPKSSTYTMEIGEHKTESPPPSAG